MAHRIRSTRMKHECVANVDNFTIIWILIMLSPLTTCQAQSQEIKRDHWTTMSTSFRTEFISSTLPLVTSTQTLLNGTEEPRRITDQEGLNKFLEKCSASMNRLRAICHKHGHSCRYRCGGRGFIRHCNCNFFCLAYKDCCWDFEEECPRIARRFRDEFESTFDQVVIEHVDGRPVIGSCGMSQNLTGNTAHQTRDNRLPLIWAIFKSNSLIFRNQSVYENCLEISQRLESPVRYSVHGIFVKKGAHTGHIDQFFLRGIVGVDDNIFVKHSKLEVPRGTPGVFKITCKHYPTNHDCHVTSNAGLYVAGSPQTCGLVSDTSVPVPINDSSYFDFNTTQTWQKADKAKFPICRASYQRAAEEIIDPDQLHVVIQADFIDGVNRPRVRTNIKYKSLNKHLRKYKCVETEEESMCQISAVCLEGYFPLRLICREATVLVVQVVGADDTSSLLTLENILHDIFVSIYERFQPSFQEFPEDMFDGFTDVSYDTSRNHKAVINFLGLKKDSRFDYQGVRLPFTDFIIEKVQIQTKDENDSEIFLGDIDIIRKVTLCVAVSEEEHHSSLLLCDRLLPVEGGGGLVLDSHFTVPGLELPDPFHDVWRQHTSTSTGSDGTHCNTLCFGGLAVMVVAFLREEALWSSG